MTINWPRGRSTDNSRTRVPGLVLWRIAAGDQAGAAPATARSSLRGGILPARFHLVRAAFAFSVRTIGSAPRE